MSGSGSRAWIDVDLGALVENARTVRASRRTALPVVKANAYGWERSPSRALEQLEPWEYGVRDERGGAELRAAGNHPRPDPRVHADARAVVRPYDLHNSPRPWATPAAFSNGPRAASVRSTSRCDTGMGRAGARLG